MPAAATKVPCLLLAAALAWGCASTGRPQGDTMVPNDPMLEEFTIAYVDLVHVARTRGGFRPVPEGATILDDALMTSMDWCDRVFRVPVHRVGDGLRHAYRMADATVGMDLLEHRLTVDSVPVNVYEAAPFLAVVVPATALTPVDPLEKAALAARLLLAVRGPVVFHPLPSRAAKLAATTDPDCSLMASAVRPIKPLSDWSDRIDAVFTEGEITLLVYKVTPEDMMTLTKNPATWFHELRTLPGP